MKKIAELSPTSTPWKKGQTLVAGSNGAWRVVDDVDPFGAERRTVSHYDTVMGEFIGWEDGLWTLAPFSIGLGSKSDQDGMNTLFKSVGSAIRFYRNGFPRYCSMHRENNQIALSYDRNRTLGNFVADSCGRWSRAN